MSGADLNVIHAAQLARVHDRGGPRRGAEQSLLDLVADGAVAIRGGHITAAGPTGALLAEWGDPAVPVLDVTGRTVLPGLVESHCHPLFKAAPHPPDADRLPLPEIAAREDGIWETVLATRAADEDELLARLAGVYARILAGGVTTLECKTGYTLTVDGEARDLRLLERSRELTAIELVCTFLGAHMVPLDAPDEDAYVDRVLVEMLPVLDGLAGYADFCCDGGLFEHRNVTRMLDAARALEIRTRVHADGWAAAGGWRTAVEYGASSADHLTFTSDDEIAEVGSTDTIATLLPIAEMIYMTERRANAAALISHEVPVAIATDYCSSIGCSSLTTTLGIAVPWFSITPSQSIVGATLNAAYGLGLGHDRGSLDPGKRGDLTILDVPHPNDIYLALGARLVDAVVIGGRVEFRAPEFPLRVRPGRDPVGASPGPERCAGGCE
ncbi:MAG: amidohydrolase family protein [Solirubrobacteraceae bacterium]